MNRAIITALGSIGAAQLIKLPLDYARNKQWDWSSLTRTGGMPSSHSAAVASLASYIALKKGVKTIDFALSAIFGIIVMYDAMGIRRHAGEIAVEVNELEMQMEKLSEQHPGFYHKRREKELKEQLGHMPIEVMAGAILGTSIGALSYLFERK
jgi:acid phosphatase family membrane protein YuiD